jgi:DNA-binding MarR family transcriptional regulator
MEGRDPELTVQAEGAVNWLHLVERVGVCSRLLRAALDHQMAACNLNPSQFSVLWACHRQREGVGQSELAEALAVSPAHVSGLVEQLRRRKFLAGHRPAADRRRQLWRLTLGGAACVESVQESLRLWAEGLESHLPPHASRALARLVDQVTAAVEATGDRPACVDQKGAA